MRKAQDGDRQAYQELLVSVTDLVRGYALREVRQLDAVEDVTQETLLSIHRDRHTYDPARPFLPWMYAIARHRLLDVLHKQRRRGENEVPGGEGWEEVAAADATVQRGTPAWLLRQALGLLSLRQREIIRMLKFEGLSVAEISQKTGLSQSSVKVTAHRGYNLLRKLMGPALGD